MKHNESFWSCGMKQIGKWICGIVLLAAVVCGVMSCGSQKGLEQRKAVAEAIAKRQLHIDITSMNTMRYGARTVTSDFYLEVRGDTLRSYLPYLGQAYQAPYASPSIGLNFETPLLTYQESRNKKDCTQLEMTAKTQEDVYQYKIDIYDTGEAFIHVASQHRDPISFTGSVLQKP